MNRMQLQKQRTHEQILAAAGQLFRATGYRNTGIDQLMHSLGLAVGGFYNHFDSKEALFREVVDSTVSEAVESIASDDVSPEDYRRNVTNRYLSAEHRDNPAVGCILPCLSAEVARANDDVRSAYTRFVTRIVGRMAEKLPDDDQLSSDERAWSLMAMAVGGLMLSRAVDDEELSQRILAACREACDHL